MASWTRRELLRLGPAALAAGLVRTSPAHAADGKPLRGALLILHTPFTADGGVDWDDLVRETLFVDRAGAQGVVWPQGSSGVATLTRDERLRGMEVLARTVRGRGVALVLGVQGRDIAEMLAPLRGRPVYVTFDIDVLDAAVMPATGTPAPGGLSYAAALALLRQACEAADSVVGADLVELAPIKGLHACDYTAAAIAYKILSYALTAVSDPLGRG